MTKLTKEQIVEAMKEPYTVGDIGDQTVEDILELPVMALETAAETIFVLLRKVAFTEEERRALEKTLEVLQALEDLQELV